MYSGQVNCKYQVADNHVVIVDCINKCSLCPRGKTCIVLVSYLCYESVNRRVTYSKNRAHKRVLRPTCTDDSIKRSFEIFLTKSSCREFRGSRKI